MIAHLALLIVPSTVGLGALLRRLGRSSLTTKTAGLANWGHKGGQHMTPWSPDLGWIEDHPYSADAEAHHTNQH